MSIFQKIGQAAKKMFVNPRQNSQEELHQMQAQMRMREQSVNEYLNPENQRLPMRPNQKEVNLLNPALDEHRDISRNKRGEFVPTMTYPLPPVKWEKKQHELNRRMRNSKNRFFE